jgi:hypothetical protein
MTHNTGMNAAMMALSDWLTATAACQWLRALTETHPLLLAAVQTLHLIGIAAIVALNGLVAIGLLQRADGAAPFAHKALPRVLAALGLQLATGLFLIVRWPERILLSPAFLPKLGLIALGLALLILAARRPAARSLGLALLLVWSAAVFAGRWIPFA